MNQNRSTKTNNRYRYNNKTSRKKSINRNEYIVLTHKVRLEVIIKGSKLQSKNFHKNQSKYPKSKQGETRTKMKHSNYSTIQILMSRYPEFSSWSTSILIVWSIQILSVFILNILFIWFYRVTFTSIFTVFSMLYLFSFSASHLFDF